MSIYVAVGVLVGIVVVVMAFVIFMWWLVMVSSGNPPA